MQRQLAPKYLTARYAFLQSAYWMAYCAVYSFAVEFLLAKGFDAAVAGTMLAISGIITSFAQPALAAVIERRGKPGVMTVVTAGAIAGIALSGVLTFASGALSAVLFAALAAMLQALLPFVNAQAFAYINRGEQLNYGLSRAIGSALFALISAFLGFFVSRVGGQSIPALGILLFSLLLVASRVVGEPEGAALARSSSEPTPLIGFLSRYRRFCVLLLGLTCLLFEHSVINSYLTQIFEGVGGSSVDKGIALAVAAISELPTMALFAQFTRKVSIKSLMRFAAVFMSVKALWFFFATSVGSLYLAHVTQMLSYALYIPASVYYVNHRMAERDRVKGVALINVPMTLGSVFGTLVGGWLLQLFGLHTLLLVSTTVSVLGSAVTWFSVEDVKETA